MSIAMAHCQTSIVAFFFSLQLSCLYLLLGFYSTLVSSSRELLFYIVDENLYHLDTNANAENELMLQINSFMIFCAASNDIAIITNVIRPTTDEHHCGWVKYKPFEKLSSCRRKS